MSEEKDMMKMMMSLAMMAQYTAIQAVVVKIGFDLAKEGVCVKSVKTVLADCEGESTVEIECDKMSIEVQTAIFKHHAKESAKAIEELKKTQPEISADVKISVDDYFVRISSMPAKA